jgi:hypothetical protein
MAELSSCGKQAEPSPNCPNTRHTANTLAGLPAHLMDELVEDLAEAVVAMLLSQATAEPDEEDDASSDLRKI